MNFDATETPQFLQLIKAYRLFRCQGIGQEASFSTHIKLK
jgi:hypothetical protein